MDCSKMPMVFPLPPILFSVTFLLAVNPFSSLGTESQESLIPFTRVKKKNHVFERSLFIAWWKLLTIQSFNSKLNPSKKTNSGYLYSMHYQSIQSFIFFQNGWTYYMLSQTLVLAITRGLATPYLRLIKKYYKVEKAIQQLSWIKKVVLCKKVKMLRCIGYRKKADNEEQEWILSWKEQNRTL